MKLKIKSKPDPNHGVVYDVVRVKTLGVIETSCDFVAGSYIRKGDAEKVLKQIQENEQKQSSD